MSQRYGYLDPRVAALLLASQAVAYCAGWVIGKGLGWVNGRVK